MAKERKKERSIQTHSRGTSMGFNIFFQFLTKHTHLTHGLAKRLLEEGIADQVGAVVEDYKGYEFIREQKEVNYDPLYCQQELHKVFEQNELDKDHLAEIEEEYGIPTLRPFMIAGGKYYNRYDYDGRRRMVQQIFDFYLDLFDGFQPDLFFTNELGTDIKWIPFHIVQQMGGQSIWWNTTRIGDQCCFSESPYDDFYTIYNTFDSISDNGCEYPDERKKAQAYLSSFHKEKIKPGYYSGASSPSRSISSLFISGIRRFKRYHFGDFKGDYKRRSTFGETIHVLKKAYRKRRIKYSNLFDEFDPGQRYIYFPLHVQPEWSTIVAAQKFLNLPYVAEQIANASPLTHEVYVKEHPYMYGKRDLNYYKRLRNIDGVKLIHPLIDSNEIIQESDIVTTVTGTSGLEALFYGKPVITLGGPHYSKIPIVRESNFQNLDYDINQLLLDYTHRDDLVLDYLTSIYKESFEFDYWGSHEHKPKTEDYIDTLFNNLIDYVELN